MGGLSEPPFLFDLHTQGMPGIGCSRRYSDARWNSQLGLGRTQSCSRACS